MTLKLSNIFQKDCVFNKQNDVQVEIPTSELLYKPKRGYKGTPMVPPKVLLSPNLIVRSVGC